MVIAIDGPAGSGKSTVAKLLAKKLNYQYIDSGAIYRVVALKLLQKKIDLNNESELLELFRDLKIMQKFENGQLKVYADGKDVTEDIRLPEVSKFVSVAAKQSVIRYHVTALLHIWSSGKDIVIEGRDIGTDVFPKAIYKYYLDASLKIRAQRRFKELQEKGYKGTFDEIENNIIQRDKIDSNRKLAPLKIASDAIVIDTSNMTVEEIVNLICQQLGN